MSDVPMIALKADIAFGADDRNQNVLDLIKPMASGFFGILNLRRGPMTLRTHKARQKRVKIP
jgi:hypothetical protein